MEIELFHPTELGVRVTVRTDVFTVNDVAEVDSDNIEHQLSNSLGEFIQAW
jgi:hypothetical protein